MPGAKQPRKRMTYRQAQLAAAAAAARRRQVRRRWMAGGTLLAVAIVVGAVALFGGGGDGGTKVATQGTTTTTEAAAAASSAEGKPCVPLADPLPAGAPDVPVQVGAPPTQLVSKDIKVGTGAAAAGTSTVTVNYIGVSCSTGKIFDTSYGKQPATFPLSGVIKGWQDGVPGMKVGGQRLLGIPPAQAYGTAGSPPDIAPDETLWFVIELTDVKAG